MTPIRRMIFKAVCLLPAFAVMPLTIWFTDPGSRIRDRGIESQRARLVAQGQNVIVPPANDYRLFVKQLIKSMSRREVAVLGSSRVLQIRSSSFEPNSFINLGVTMATLHELIAVTQWLRASEKMPEHLVVCIDPWMLSGSQADTTPEIRADAETLLTHRSTVSTPAAAKQLLKKCKRLFSPAYFQICLGSVAAECYEIKPIDDVDQPYQVRLADGSGVATAQIRNRDPALRQRLAEKELSSPSLLGMYQPQADKNLRADLEQFLASAPNVHILLVPVHPKLYRILQSDPRYFGALETERLMRQMAAERHIPVVGSYDPACIEVTEADFWDLHHLTPEAMELLTVQLAEGMHRADGRVARMAESSEK